jgi:hypothetical protein
LVFDRTNRYSTIQTYACLYTTEIQGEKVIKLSYAGEGGKITDLPETKKLRNSDDVDKVDEVLPF